MKQHVQGRLIGPSRVCDGGRGLAVVLLVAAWAQIAPVAAAEGATGMGGAGEGGTHVLIVARDAESVELYFALPAAELPDLFGTGAGPLVGYDGTIDVTNFERPTDALAADIMAGSRITIDGAEIGLEAISTMVHDPDFLPDFATPWDGLIALKACTSAELVDGKGLGELRAYLGYTAWKVPGGGALRVDLPETGRAPVSLEIREFWSGRLTGVRREVLGDGQDLVLDRARTPPPALRLASWSVCGLALAGVAAAAFGLWPANRLPRRREPGLALGGRGDRMSVDDT